MCHMLKPGVKLCFFDVVFSFPVESYQSELDKWVNGMRKQARLAMADLRKCPSLSKGAGVSGTALLTQLISIKTQYPFHVTFRNL